MVLDEMCASEYLNQLLQDKTTVSKMPKIFLHSERLLDEEINKVRNDIFSPSSFLMSLPKPQGPVVKLTEKVYAKVKEYPKFNFVGRIIGPRGLTLRQVEQETGCKLLVRGRGSMKDKKMEEEKIGQPNYEHLQEDLHVLIMVEDTEERARLKLQKAREEVSFLMVPPKDGEDDIKKKQLQDLAILNGTYRPHHDQMPPNAVGNASTLIEVSPPSLQNGLINFPSPTPMLPSMTPNPAQQSFPGLPRGNSGEPIQPPHFNFEHFEQVFMNLSIGTSFTQQQNGQQQQQQQGQQGQQQQQHLTNGTHYWPLSTSPITSNTISSPIPSPSITIDHNTKQVHVF